MTSINGDRAPARTTAATAARRAQKSERLIAELVPRLPELDRPLLAALAMMVLDEVERRSAAPGRPTLEWRNE